MKIHKNQEVILESLLDVTEGLTLGELAKKLGISKSGTKEHIIKLEAFGYIQYKDIVGSVGRPKRAYLLTEQGQEVFPKQYSWLSNTILECLIKHLSPFKLLIHLNLDIYVTH